MVRARRRPDGMTAPTCSGFSIHDRRKRTSSSRRGFFNARTDDCKGIVGTRRDRGILRWMSENGHKEVQVGGGAVKPNGEAPAHRGHSGTADKAWRFLSFSAQVTPAKCAGARTSVLIESEPKF